MTVTHVFKKRPAPKNLKNRSVSFEAREITLVKEGDDVLIEVYGPSTVTKVIVPGRGFLATLEDKTLKDGTKILVFKY